jgi:hypothetical protein
MLLPLPWGGCQHSPLAGCGYSIPYCSLPCSLSRVLLTYYPSWLRAYYGGELNRSSNRSKSTRAIEKPPEWGLHLLSGSLWARRVYRPGVVRYVEALLNAEGPQTLQVGVLWPFGLVLSSVGAFVGMAQCGGHAHFRTPLLREFGHLRRIL